MKRLAVTLVAFQLLATAAGAQSSAPTPAVRSTLEILNSAKMPIVFDISCDPAP